MKPYDERLQYYLTVARLLTEADLQLEADSEDPGSAPYGESLEELREALEIALAATMRISAEIRTLRAQALMQGAAAASPAIRRVRH